MLLAWPCTNMAFTLSLLGNLILRQDHGIEPARERNAGAFP